MLFFDQDSHQKIEDIRHALKELIGDSLRIERVPGGKNNRTWRLEKDGRAYLIKEYFQHPGDQRNRQENEYAFLLYAGEVAPGYVPTVFLKDQKYGFSVFEYCDGSKLAAIGATEILAAADFFSRLNPQIKPRLADSLSWASESATSIAGHIEIVQRRVQRVADNAMHSEDRRFKQLAEKISEEWRGLSGNIANASVADQASLNASRVTPGQICISPSDFGFHNALKVGEKYVFIDFEYGGWDDPAKMICDFFWQPQIPISDSYWDCFIAQALKEFSEAREITERARLLFPVFGIKWCCIALNIFDDVHRRRRIFSGNQDDRNDSESIQLSLAEHLLDRLRSSKR